MPIKKLNVRYVCEICGQEYDKLKDAKLCEKEGFAVPEFKNHEIVEIFGIIDDAEKYSERTFIGGRKLILKNGMKGIVHCSVDYSKESYTNYHLLPISYAVFFEIPENPRYRGLTVISRDYLRKSFVELDKKTNKIICPICSGLSISKKMASCDVVDGLPSVNDIPTNYCDNCGATFFNSDQITYIETKLIRTLKWPAADTKKLIANVNFRYR
ncbi:MAG: hypothetical protein M1334_00545 [Patescibacteria group bacterium]|nr:hypothetical protein [Patescibacteria group bacterium]